MKRIFCLILCVVFIAVSGSSMPKASVYNTVELEEGLNTFVFDKSKASSSKQELSFYPEYAGNGYISFKANRSFSIAATIYGPDKPRHFKCDLNEGYTFSLGKDEFLEVTVSGYVNNLFKKNRTINIYVSYSPILEKIDKKEVKEAYADFEDANPNELIEFKINKPNACYTSIEPIKTTLETILHPFFNHHLEKLVGGEELVQVIDSTCNVISVKDNNRKMTVKVPKRIFTDVIADMSGTDYIKKLEELDIVKIEQTAPIGASLKMTFDYAKKAVNSPMLISSVKNVQQAWRYKENYNMYYCYFVGNMEAKRNKKNEITGVTYEGILNIVERRSSGQINSTIVVTSFDYDNK